MILYLFSLLLKTFLLACFLIAAPIIAVILWGGFALYKISRNTERKQTRQNQQQESKRQRQKRQEKGMKPNPTKYQQPIYDDENAEYVDYEEL